MFNTGTNFLDIQMQQNIIGLTQKSIWQVPWGKHRMAYVKWNHTAPSMDKYNKTNVFPIIVIRDPYSWMQSMCKSPYAALWRHKKHHCPNLVPSPEVDSAHYPPAVLKKSAFPVTVEFDEKHLVHFTSLAHLWSEWYKLYINVDYPALMSKLKKINYKREIAPKLFVSLLIFSLTITMVFLTLFCCISSWICGKNFTIHFLSHCSPLRGVSLSTYTKS